VQLDDFIKLNLTQLSRVEEITQKLVNRNMSKKALEKKYISDLINN
jgi:hypothetical protein